MPFSNDEVIIEEKAPKIKTPVIITGVGLFLLSLFNDCFCTDAGCRTSIEALLTGWLAMLTGGAGLAWIANPLLIISWVLLAKNKKLAWLFSLLAIIASLSFLKFNVIIENEAGQLRTIIKIGVGYWLWLSSCIITFIGTLTIQILRRKIS